MALREIFARFSTRFDGSALRRGNSQVAGLTGRLGGALGSLRTLGRAFAALEIVRIVAGWIGAVRGFISSITEAGDELDKTSRVIGISSGELQEWRHAAKLSGVEASSFSQGLIRIQNNMRQSLITPTSSAALAFRRLGVDLRDADGNMRNVSDVLTDMADPLQGLASDSERVAILTALAGRSGARMGPLFEQGREGIEAMRGELEALGGGASQDMIQAAADLTDAQARLDLATLSLKSRIATALLPIIESSVESLTQMVSWVSQNEEAGRLFEATLYTLAAAIIYVAVVALIGTFPLWLAAIVIFGLIVVVIGAIILVVEDLITWFRGGESVIGSFIDAMLALAGISMADVRAEINSVFDALRDGYNAVADVVGLPTISGSSSGSGSAAAGGTATPGEDVDEGPTSGQRFLQQLRVAGAEARLPGAVNSIVAPAPAGTTGRPNVTQRNEVTINGATDTEAVRSVVADVLDRGNRDAVEALGQ